MMNARSLTRRGFCWICGGSLVSRGQNCDPPAGTPQAFVPPANGASIPRKAISALNPQEVARLRLAYERLRALPTSDSRGWMQQANVHCYQCGGNPSGNDIHQSWLFLPWHRAYLYFHERILARLLNDNTFRLPYWDWDVPANRSVPAIFRPASAEGRRNSLFDPNRTTNTGSSMPAGIFPPAANPMNSSTFSTFGGQSGAGGAMENGPHGGIHVWTAGGSRPDMGRLDTAARDPLFYAHHCNIDRLWAEWMRRDPANRRNPTSISWLNRSFTFFDENQVLRRIQIRQVLDTGRGLGYSYPPGAALSSPVLSRRFPLLRSASRVRMPAGVREQLTTTPGINVTRSLVVQNVRLPAASGYYHVFAGDPPATGDPTQSPAYMGYIGIIRGPHAHEERPASLVLEAPRRFLELAARPEGVALSIRAVDVGDGQPSGSTRLAFESVYLLEG